MIWRTNCKRTVVAAVRQPSEEADTATRREIMQAGKKENQQ